MNKVLLTVVALPFCFSAKAMDSLTDLQAVMADIETFKTEMKICNIVGLELINTAQQITNTQAKSILLKRAKQWLTPAAENGNETAQYNLGFSCFQLARIESTLREPLLKEAQRWFALLIKKIPLAAVNFGLSLLDEADIHNDHEAKKTLLQEAQKLFASIKEAALIEQAKSHLGTAYLKEAIITTNEDKKLSLLREAQQLLRPAAEKEDPIAKINLSQAYFEEAVVTKDEKLREALLKHYESLKGTSKESGSI